MIKGVSPATTCFQFQRHHTCIYVAQQLLNGHIRHLRTDQYGNPNFCLLAGVGAFERLEKDTTGKAYGIYIWWNGCAWVRVGMTVRSHNIRKNIHDENAVSRPDISLCYRYFRHESASSSSSTISPRGKWSDIKFYCPICVYPSDKKPLESVIHKDLLSIFEWERFFHRRVKKDETKMQWLLYGFEMFYGILMTPADNCNTSPGCESLWKSSGQTAL